MRARKLVAIGAMLGFILPATSFAQDGQQQGQQAQQRQQEQRQQEQQQQDRQAQGDERISADIKMKPEVQLSDEERRALSLAGGRLLSHVYHARQAIQQEQKDRAMRQIDRGITLVQIIENAVPTYQVTARIQAGEVVYEDNQRVKVMTVPIYTELEAVTLMAPLMAARKEAAGGAMMGRDPHSGRSAHQQQARQDGQAHHMLPADAAPVVAGTGLQHTQVLLDVSTARQHLEAAKRALQEERYEVADGALAAVQRGVSFGYTEVDLPLITARQNLMLARQRAEAGRLQEARAALDATADALETYEGRVGRARAVRVQNLRQEIEGYTDQLAQDKKDHQEVSERIDQWWGRIVRWSDRA